MAAFTGGNRKEWAGPKNPSGTASFHIYQYNEPVGSLGEAFENGDHFTVTWYYEPSEAEIAAGITTRQRLAIVFGPKDTYVGILGAMYRARRDRMERWTGISGTPENKESALDDFR